MAKIAAFDFNYMDDAGVLRPFTSGTPGASISVFRISTMADIAPIIYIGISGRVPDTPVALPVGEELILRIGPAGQHFGASSVKTRVVNDNEVGPIGALTVRPSNLTTAAPVVTPTQTELHWHYADEPAQSAKFLGFFPIGQEVDVPLNAETERDIIVRAVAVNPYSPTKEPLETAPFVKISGSHVNPVNPLPLVTIATMPNYTFVRCGVDNWNRYSRVREVWIQQPSISGVYKFIFDIDNGGEGQESEFDELPDFFDIERSLPYLLDQEITIRVRHSGESSAAAEGATYLERLNNLTWGEYSNPVVVHFANSPTTHDGEPATAEGEVGISDAILVEEPSTSPHQTLVCSAAHLRPAGIYEPGILMPAPYIQQLGGRKVWHNQHIFGSSLDLPNVREPITTLYPGFPSGISVLGYSELNDHFQIGAIGSYSRSDTPADPGRVHLIRGRQQSGAQAVIKDDILGRIAVGAKVDNDPNTPITKYSSRIDFRADDVVAPDKLPTAIEFFVGNTPIGGGGDDYGQRSLLLDSKRNVVTGKDNLSAAATAGFLWVPQFIDTPTAAPSPDYPGWKPIAFVEDAIYTHDGTNWIQVSGGAQQTEGTWVWSSALSGAVANGVVAVNNDDPSLATELRIAELADDSTDISAILQTLIPGDVIYIQNTADNTRWVRYAVNGPGVDVGTYRTIPIEIVDYGGLDLNDLQVNAVFIRGGGGGGGGGANPAGTGSEVQYRMNATTFGAVTNSSVSGADVQFGGNFQINQSTGNVVTIIKVTDAAECGQLNFNRARVGDVDLVGNDLTGRIVFYGRFAGGSNKQLGYLQSQYSTAYGPPSGLVTLGTGEFANARIELLQTDAGTGGVTIWGNAATHYFQVQHQGFQFSHGTTGSLYYKTVTTPTVNGYFVSLDIDQALDAGKILTVTDTGGGVLYPRWVAAPAAAGPPRLDQVLDPVIAEPGVKLFNMAETQLGFEFNGTQNEDSFVIQSKADALGSGAVMVIRTLGTLTNKSPLRIEGRGAFYFSVGVGGNVGVGIESATEKLQVQGGKLLINDATNKILIDPTLISFQDAAQRAYIYSYQDASLGNVIALGAGIDDEARVLVTHGATIERNITLIAAPNYFQVQYQGFQFSHGTTGSMYYKAGPSPDAGWFVDLPIGTLGQALTVKDVGGKLLPQWGTLAASGAFPDGAGSELQARASDTTFKAVASSSALGADVTLSGFFKIKANGSENQEILCSALVGTTTYIGMTQYRETVEPIVLQFTRARGVFGLPLALHSEDEIGDIRFLGFVGADFVKLGSVRGSWDAVLGGRVDMAAGLARVTVMQNFGIQLAEDTSGNTLTVATGGFTFSHGTRGAVYWKNVDGHFVALPIGNTNQVLTAVDIGGGVREPQWTSLTPGGANPDGIASELQARNTSNSFKAVTGSATSGADISLAGTLSFTYPVEGVVGIIQGTWNATDGDSLVLGVTDGTRVMIRETTGISLLEQTSGLYFTVAPQGFYFSQGGPGAIWHNNASGYFYPLGPGANGTYLRSNGTLPEWVAIQPADITGVSPTSGQLLIGNAASGFTLNTLTAGPNIQIANGNGTITITGSAAPESVLPDGIGTELQSRKADGTAFQRVTGSSVSGGNVSLVGSLTLATATENIIIAPGGGGGVAGRVVFTGTVGGTPTSLAYLQSHWVEGDGASIEITASDASKIIVRELTGISLYEATSGNYFNVTQQGFYFSNSVIGALWHTNASSFFAPLAVGADGTFLRMVGTMPQWTAVSLADISGILPIAKGGTGTGSAPTSGTLLIGNAAGGYTVAGLTAGPNIQIAAGDGTITITASAAPESVLPDGVATELQSRKADGTAFQRVTGSSVSGADITLAGLLTFTHATGGSVGGIQGTWNASDGDSLIIAASNATRIMVRELTGISLYEASAGLYFTVSPQGFYFSQGGPGALWHNNASGYFYPLTIGAGGTFLKSSGTMPVWSALSFDDITTGVLPIAKGGTGTAQAPSAGRLLIGNASSGYSVANITAGNGIEVINGDGAITLNCTVTPGGGAFPQGGDGTLQYRANATTFGSVLNSSVSGANITLQGSITLAVANDIVVVHAGGGVAGRVIFSGLAGGPSPVQLGYLQSHWLADDGASIEITVRDGSKVTVRETTGISLYEATTGQYFNITHSGFYFSHGAAGALWYNNASSFFAPLLIDAAGKFVKSTGTLPVYAFIDASDIKSGVLPIAYGGTGTASAPTSGKLLIGNASGGYTVATLTESDGILITEGDGTITIKCTVVPGGGAFPQGANNTLQYKVDGSTFGGLTGSVVTGSSVSLAGTLTVQAAGENVVVSANAIAFNLAAAQRGHVYGFNDVTLGDVVQVGASDGSHLRVQSIKGVVLYEATSGLYFSIGPSGGGTPGFYFSQGGPGDMWYNHETTGLFYPLSIAASGNFLKSNGVRPVWSGITVNDWTGVVPITKGGTNLSTGPASGKLLIGNSGAWSIGTLQASDGIQIIEGNGTLTVKCTVVPGGGALPQGANNTLQYKVDGSTFGGLSGSIVTGAHLTLGGMLTLPAGVFLEGAVVGSWGNTLTLGAGSTRLYVRQNEGISLYDASGLYFTVQPAGFYFSQGGPGALWYNHETTGMFYPIAIATTSGKYLKSDGIKPFWADLPPATGGGEPGGSDRQIQFNNDGSFEGMPGFEIVAAGTSNLVLGGGYFQLVSGLTSHVPDLTQEFFISATTAAATRFTMRRFSDTQTTGVSPVIQVMQYIEFDRGRGSGSNKQNMQSGDWLGEVRYAGQIAGAIRQLGYVRGSYVSNGTVEIGAGLLANPGDTAATRITLSGTGGVYMQDASGRYFGWGTDGFFFSHGTGGGIYYTDPSTLKMVNLPINTTNTYVLRTDGLKPYWGPAPGGTGGPTLGGSDNQLVYRVNSGALATLPISTWDGATLFMTTGIDFKSNSAMTVHMRLYQGNDNVGPAIQFTRARGSESVRQPVWSNNIISQIVSTAHYDTTTNVRQAAVYEVIAQSNWSSTVAPAYMRIKTSAVSGLPYGRVLIGCVKVLPNDTLTDLFSIAFGVSDHMGLAGEIHLVYVAKGILGSTQTQVYKRKIKFAVYHNASNNAAGCMFTEEYDTIPAPPLSYAYSVYPGRYGLSSGGGLTRINHALQGAAYPGVDTSQQISSVGGWNTMTYRTLVTSDLSSIFSLTCYYNIFYSGEGEITPAA